MIRPLLLFPALVLIAACGRSDEEGTSISLNADNGQVIGGIDGNSGALKIDVPGFKGEIALPKIKFDADDLDLNGVNLYPGSTVDAVNVGQNGDGPDGVRVSFTAPASPQVVRNWFQGRLKTAGYELRTEGNALIGQTREEKPFRMELNRRSGDTATGTITIGG